MSNKEYLMRQFQAFLTGDVNRQQRGCAPMVFMMQQYREFIVQTRWLGVLRSLACGRVLASDDEQGSLAGFGLLHR